MARPISETPILFGEEARQFDLRMMNPPRISSKLRSQIMRDYEMMRGLGVNCSF